MVESCYVHVPFCRTICHYCDFSRVHYNDSLVEKWLVALKEEVNQKKMSEKLKTLYFGGGTPNSLTDSQLNQLLSIFDRYTQEIEEYTIELNPECITETQVDILVRHGVNRVSLGVQSTQVNLLKTLNRKHSPDEVRQNIELLRKKGITNISVDVMYSLPTQTLLDLKECLEEVTSWPIQHISIYSLTIEKNSFFGRKGMKSLDCDIEADMYEYILSFLQQKEFIQYEISSFSKKNYPSKHNLAYWHYDDFYGIGLGASGKENHKRYDHKYDFEQYIHMNFELQEIDLSKEDEMFEMLMMGLRLKEGMSCVLFEERFHQKLEDVYKEPLKKCIQQGTLEINEDTIKATERGYMILNTVLEEFI